MSDFLTQKCLNCGAEFLTSEESLEQAALCDRSETGDVDGCEIVDRTLGVNGGGSDLSQVVDGSQHSGHSAKAVDTAGESHGDGTAVDIGPRRSLDQTVWTSDALCRGKTEIFFAPPGERSGRRRRREAVAMSYCSQCPVSDPCKEAGRGGREHGFWGGENDEKRSEAGYGPSHPHRRAVIEAAKRAGENFS